MLNTNTKNLNKLFEKYAVEKAYVFGSYARGDNKRESDIDLMLEFEKSPGLIDFVRLSNELEEYFGRPADVVTENSLVEQIKAFVEKDLTLIYEKR